MTQNVPPMGVFHQAYANTLSDQPAQQTWYIYVRSKADDMASLV